MELKTLSNNWKKLQATLNKEKPASKRATEIQLQNGLKRKRTANTTVDKKADRPRKFLKPRRMAEVVEEEKRVKTPSSSRRSSTASKEVHHDGQINEGLSPT
jgi:RNA exonuclease 4